MLEAPVEKKEIRILIVDDSRVARAMIGKVLHGTLPNVVIAGYADDGDSALAALDVCNPDIVILDLAMPRMDGMMVLPLILKKKPGIRVVVCSSLSPPGAEISVRALFLGAAVCVSKPRGVKNQAALTEFETSLQQAVMGLYETSSSSSFSGAVANAPSLVSFHPRIIAIASSTGGPNALMALLKDTGRLPVPIVITQHVMDNFSAPLVRQLAQETGLPCFEAHEGMELEPACVYMAASGTHMRLRKAAAQTVISLDHGPLENFCRPSADVMLRSVADIYGGAALAVILTGMGKDGLNGCKEIAKVGGRIIVQDRETSAVWGMPGSIVNAGLASAMMPLSGIASCLRSITLNNINGDL